MTRHRMWKTALALLVLAACSSDITKPIVVQTLNSIAVQLDVTTLNVGQTAQAAATLKDSDGRNMTVNGDTVAWASSNQAVATIAPKTGIVTALSAGSTVISAASKGKVGTANLVVVGPSAPVGNPVASLAVSVATPTLRRGRATQASATAMDMTGKALMDRQITWSSSDASIASVSSAGTVTGMAVGLATISATSEGVTGSVPVTVLAPTIVTSLALKLDASTIQVATIAQGTVTAKDSAGGVVTGLPTTWSSSNPAVATVSPTGAITGVSLGTSTISATMDGSTATATLTVGPPAVATIIIVIPSQMNVGDSAVALVTLGDADGNLLSGRVVSWVSNNPTIASIDAKTGVVKALFAGSAIITATSEQQSANALVRILAGSSSPPGGSPPPPSSPPPSGGGGSPSTGTASQLTISAQPSSTAQSGAAFGQQPSVQVRDASNNAVAQVGVAVTASLASGAGTLGGTTTATTNASGVATFTNLSITGAVGNRTLRFSASNLTAAVSNTIAVTAAAATQLGIGTQPSSTAQSGVAFSLQPTVQLLDASNSAVAQSGVVVTASIATGTGSLGGTLTATTNTGGLATFTNLRITGTGSNTLRFAATGLAALTCCTVSVTAAPASKLAIATPPSASAPSGAAFAQQPAIQLQDASGNPVAANGVAVTVAIASGGGLLSGSSTANTNAAGVATFTGLAITGTTGVRTLSFSAASYAATSSGSISITAGSANKLTIMTQPSATVAGATAFAQQPAVQLLDASSNPVSQSGVVVTASIASGGGTLGGTTTATTNASGVATFANLSISGADGSRTLGFASGTLTSATSSAISVITQILPPPGGVQPMILEDFSTYSSTSNLLANPGGIWDTGNKLNTNQIALDQSVGYGSSTQSMRYDFPNNGAVCMDYGMHPGSLNLGRPTHIWVEFVVRFKTNWTLDAGATGCAQEYKLAAMGDNVSGIGRWNVPEMQVGELVSGYPGNDAGFISGMDVRAKLWDGQPHVFRVEAKIGHANDGIFKFWLDGTLLVNQTGITTDPTHNYITYFAPGMNINQGPGVTGMSMWWHKIAIYSADPGWQ